MLATNYKLQATSYKGFTLIEVVVAVFAFLVIMMAVSQVFVQAFRGYSSAKIVQRDLEAAQFAINTLAKELRTSSIVSSTSSSVQFYDHSQGICFRYLIHNPSSALQVSKEQEPVNLSESARQERCANSFSPSATATIANGIVSGAFSVVPSDGTSSPKVVGKVTVSLTIGEGALHRARIQSTAALRDFGSIAP